MYYVRYFDEIMRQPECRIAIDFFDRSSPRHVRYEKDGEYTSGGRANRQITELAIRYDEDTDVFNMIYRKMIEALMKYIEVTEAENIPCMICDEIRIKKYNANEGDFIGWHCDGAMYEKRDRVLQVLVYLNDVKEGGETIFRVAGTDMDIKPVEGRIAIFPTTFQYLHKADAPISGDKYVAVASFSYAPTPCPQTE